MKKSIHDIEEQSEFLELIDKGYQIDINETMGPQKVNALYYASRKKRDWLIKHGIDINHRDIYGQNMLHNSTFNDWKFWIEKGIDIHQIDNEGENILFSCKYYEQAKLFINQGIDIHLINKKNENLFFKLDENYNMRETFDFYMSQNLNIHQVNNKGQNVLFINKTTPDMKKIWIENGVDVNKEDSVGETPLFYADSTTIIDLLIEKGIDINKKNKSNQNAFISYCKYGDLTIAKHLMNKGIDLNIDLSIMKSKMWKYFSPEIKEFLTIHVLIQKEKEHLLKNLKEDELTDIYKKRL